MKAMQCCPTIKSSLYIKYNRRSYNMKHKPYTQGLSTKANYNDIYSGITMLIQRCSPGGFLSHTQNIYIITTYFGDFWQAGISTHGYWQVLCFSDLFGGTASLIYLLRWTQSLDVEHSLKRIVKYVWYATVLFPHSEIFNRPISLHLTSSLPVYSLFSYVPD